MKIQGITTPLTLPAMASFFILQPYPDDAVGGNVEVIAKPAQHQIMEPDVGIPLFDPAELADADPKDLRHFFPGHAKMLPGVADILPEIGNPLIHNVPPFHIL